MFPHAYPQRSVILRLFLLGSSLILKVTLKKEIREIFKLKGIPVIILN